MTVKILKIAMRHLVASVAPVRNKKLKNLLKMMTFCTNMCAEGSSANLCVQLVHCSLLTPNIALISVIFLLLQVNF